MNGDLQRFDACLPFVLIQEAPHPDDWSNPSNFSNDQHDPGGKTMCGITQREYDHYRKSHGWTVRDVRELTRDEGDDIYLSSYWLPHCQSLPPGLDLSFFDCSVNEGSFEATKILQHALGVAGDGKWGIETISAIADIVYTPDIIRRFAARREEVYHEIANFKYFGDDWIRRSREIKAHSLTLAMGK
jgi:lysozyme family protein